MESSAAPRDGGEREAPENSNSIRLRRAQELLELLAAAGVDRRPPARATKSTRIEQTVASTARNARRELSAPVSLACRRDLVFSRPTQAIGLSFHESGV